MRREGDGEIWRPVMLVVLLIEIVLLIVVLFADIAGWWPLDLLGDTIGIVPVVVPWAGAVGGVAIAIVGLVAHWDDSAERGGSAAKWIAWYLTRLPLGALFGTIACLIVILFIGTIGVTDTGAIDTSPTGVATLAVISFVVAYQQEVFTRLLRRVVSVILGPGEESTTDAPSRGVDLHAKESALDFGQVTVGETLQRRLTLENKGRAGARIPVDAVAFSSEAYSLGTTSIGFVRGGASRYIDISFTPDAARAYDGTVTVAVGGKSVEVALSGTGVTARAAAPAVAAPAAAAPAAPPSAALAPAAVPPQNDPSAPT